MKVAFVLPAFPVLHNTFTLNEIVGLIRHGVDVSILSLNRPRDNGGLLNADVARYDLLRRTRFFDTFAGSGPDVPDTCDPWMRHFQPRTPPWWRMLLHGSLRAPRPKVYPFAAVAQWLVEEKYDVIHGAFGNRPATAALVLSTISGIPFTFEVHAYDLFVDFPFSRAKLDRASAVFTISQYNRRYLMETCGAPDGKVHVVRVSPNTPMLAGARAAARQEGLVVSACRLDPIKGLVYALQAMARIRAQRPRLRYEIIGDGPLRGELMAEARRLRIEDIVTFVGNVTNEDVCSRMRRAAVFLLPSVVAADGNRDGTPTAIAEAMQLEIPIVSSALSGIPELVEDEVTGILTKPGDVTAIATALDRLLQDESLRTRMGRAGKEKVVRECNVDTNVAAVRACWEEIVAGRPSAATQDAPNEWWNTAPATRRLHAAGDRA